MKNHLLSVLLVFIFFFAGTLFPVEAKEKPDQGCPLFGAEYVPHSSYVPYDDLDFVLRIVGPEPKGPSTIRTMFLLFEAYDKSGQKVSSMRFGDAWSNGDSRQSFSTFYGQYNNPYDQQAWQDFRGASFYPIGVNDDLSQANILVTPFMLIFPGTHWALRYNSKQHPENWDQYIKFFTESRIYPDFGGYDFWVRRKCGEENQ